MGKNLIPNHMSDHHKQVRSYGFKCSVTPDDLTDFVVEAMSKAARWHKGELLAITMDIQTAFDAMEHDTLHASNNELQIPPLDKITCVKDLHEQTAAITLTQHGTSNPFPVSTGGWQGGTATPNEFVNTLTVSLAPAVHKWEINEIGLHIEVKDTDGTRHKETHEPCCLCRQYRFTRRNGN